MYKIIGLIIITLLTGMDAYAQNRRSWIIIDNDTLPYFILHEVVVSAKSKRYRLDVKRQERLEYNVRKAYPYARIAAKKIGEIEQRLATISDKKKQKELIKTEYNELMRTFKKPLMKLTISQGRILIKLVYRETNNSSFTHIKEYKGGFNAYFWQSLALLFGNNLKSEYDGNGEDRDIEEIVKKIEAGMQ